MSTRTNRPTGTSAAGPAADGWPEDEVTVVDGAQFVEALNETPRDWEAVTPVEIPRCAECGSAVFEDGFDEMAMAIGLDRCVRSRPGSERPWYWCSGYSPTHRKLVQFVPR